MQTAARATPTAVPNNSQRKHSHARSRAISMRPKQRPKLNALRWSKRMPACTCCANASTSLGNFRRDSSVVSDMVFSGSFSIFRRGLSVAPSAERQPMVSKGCVNFLNRGGLGKGGCGAFAGAVKNIVLPSGGVEDRTRTPGIFAIWRIGNCGWTTFVGNGSTINSVFPQAGTSWQKGDCDSKCAWNSRCNIWLVYNASSL